MKVVLQPSGCHWVVRAVCSPAWLDRFFVSNPARAAGVCAPQRGGQGSPTLTPYADKPIIPKL